MKPDLRILQEPENKKEPLWVTSTYTNIRRYVPSGTYYAHAKIHGKLIRQSLKTDVLPTAKKRLDSLLASERKRIGKLPEVTGAWLFKQLADVWADDISNDQDLKQRAIDYRLETLKAIRDNTDNIDAMAPAHFTADWCERWAKKFRKKYSGSRFNGCLQTLRAILQTAVERGLIAENPTKGIEHAEVKRKPIELPTRRQFDLILKKLTERPDRRRAYHAVRFMLFTGMRPSAAIKVLPKHIDFENNEIVVPPLKHQDEPIRIPMVGGIREACKDLLKDYPGTGPLIQIKDPRRSLRTICKELEIPRITSKTLRHAFTTTCLESRVDVKTVAEWRGDKDGGAMLLKTYAHLRNEHSHKMAKKVKF